MFDAIFKEAQEAGEKALDEYTDKYGIDSGACGFAWVTVRPARGKFITWCKKQIKEAAAAFPDGSREQRMAIQNAEGTYGSNAYGGGWQFWSAGSRNYRGQSVDAKETAARAFAAVLRNHGIEARAGSRMD